LEKHGSAPIRFAAFLKSGENEGFFNTLAQVREKLDEPMTMMSIMNGVGNWQKGRENLVNRSSMFG